MWNGTDLLPALLSAEPQTKNNINRNIYAQKGLSLYLKFNEPSGSYTNAALCVDSSGNKIHGIILVKNEVDQTYSIPVDTSSYKNNMTSLTLEKLEENPVLNLNYPLISEKRNKIYEKAKEFDSKNPNIIFKLLPAHYFIESSNFQNLPIYNNNIESFTLPESFSNENGKLENPSQLESLTPSQLKALNPSQLKALNPSQLKASKPAQRKAL